MFVVSEFTLRMQIINYELINRKILSDAHARAVIEDLENVYGRRLYKCECKFRESI